MSPDEIQSLQDRRSDAAMPPGLEGVAATAVVRWASARTVREAMMRSGVQRGLLTPAQFQNAASISTLDGYAVYVDLRVHVSDVQRIPASGVFTAALVQNSVLVLKSNGERVSPLEVKQAPLPEFDDRREIAIGAFYVLFPKQQNGKPLLAADESIVRFECPTVPVPITAEFELRKMSRGGSPDF